MNTTEQSLKRIQDKVQSMLKQHLALQKENETLREELAQVKKQATISGEQSAMLRQRMEIIKYSGGEMDEADKKQFEKRINTYIREIDRCIAMLSQ
jgi:hypothetical protein